MCGISGFNFLDEPVALEMNKATHHRGPDQTAIFSSAEMTLGFNRLAIIDLSERGSQPMWDNRREVVIVFNGEIYNFKELRAELEKDFTFRSESDTEVILNLYIKYGRDAVKKLNGMFAFAIWDTRTKELVIARDHMGIKPLYYFWDGKKLIFSSEIKAILKHNIPRAVNAEAFSLHFSFLYTPSPHTMFAGIKKLPPASLARLKNGSFTIEKFWSSDTVAVSLGTYNETKNKIKTIFDDAVKKQLVSDRPVGIFLSGGLDSTAVLGSAAGQTLGAIKTYSIGFDHVDPKYNKDMNLARETAAFYQTNHHEYTLSARDVSDHAAKIAWHLDEPNSNPTAAAMYMLAHKAKESVTVVLGGDGADELFGGYPRYYYSRLISRVQSIPGLSEFSALALKVLGRGEDAKKLTLPPNQKRIAAFLAQKKEDVQKILAPSMYTSDNVDTFLFDQFFAHKKLSRDFESEFMNLDRQSWLVDESLLRTDKMGMAASIEERVPVLDARLVELARHIPTSWKLSIWNQRGQTFQGKRIWRDAIKEYIPEHIFNEQKRGWFTPMAKWLRTDLKTFAEDILSNVHPDYFNRAEVLAMWQDHLSGKRYNLNLIWAVIMWQLWYNQFIKK